MQRALSLSKQATALSVLQKRQAQQLCNLLPPGPNTVYGLDMVRVLASAQKLYRVTIPISLVWSPGKAIVLHNGPEGEIKLKSHWKLCDGLADFFQEVKSQFGSIPPKFTYKLEAHSSIILSTRGEIEAQILSNPASCQRLQPWVSAYSRHTSHLRVQWLCSRPRNLYFVKVKSTKSLATPPCLAKSLPALSRSFTNVDCINTEDCLAPTKLSPISEIDTAMNECVKAIGETTKSRKVKELVCDFLCDGKQNWVLVNTVGYSFTTHMKANSEVLAPKLAIDLKFILTPLMVQRKSFRFAFKRETNPLHQAAVPIIETNHEPTTLISRQKTPARKQRIETETKTLPQLAFLHSTVSKYDTICANVQKLKKQEKTDLVAKYGAKLWKEVVSSLVSALVNELLSSTEPQESFGEEQAHMIQRGFLRIIQGDYNFYYVAALNRVHKSLCIPQATFDSFITILFPTLAATPLLPSETDAVIMRFQDLKRAICSGNSKLS